VVNQELTEADFLIGAYAGINVGLSLIGDLDEDLPPLSFNYFKKEWKEHYPTSGPPTIVQHPLPQYVKIGDSASFNVEAMATNTLSYQWYQDGRILPGKTDDVLAIDEVLSGHRGNYHVRVSAGGESVVSSNAPLVIVAEGSVNLAYSNPIVSNMAWGYAGAEFDTYYTQPPHWKITHLNGYLGFAFDGQQSFNYHVHGSKIEGVSHCHINIWINDQLYQSGRYIDSVWKTHRIPASAFVNGRNVIFLELTTSPSGTGSHLWINRVYVK
jgi:hypothetical protein